MACDNFQTSDLRSNLYAPGYILQVCNNTQQNVAELSGDMWPVCMGLSHVTVKFGQLFVSILRRRTKSLAHISQINTPRPTSLSRCHAVDALIGSTTGRSKLSQLLLALLVSEPKFSYIQGMDSLAAVCLKLFYVSPPRALLLLRAVINRFLGKVVYKVCN